MTPAHHLQFLLQPSARRVVARAVVAGSMPVSKRHRAERKSHPAAPQAI